MPTVERVRDLSEHELRSLRGWLNSMFPGRKIFIYRPTTEFERPALTLSQATPRQPTNLGRGFGHRWEVTYQIEVLGSGDTVGDAFWSTRRELDQISGRLLTTQLIPLYLYSWQYPSPKVEVVPGGGALPAGDVSVVVTAVNAQDEESLGSEAVEVTVPAGAGLNVLIPPWPRQSGVAEVFRVYAGAAGSEELQVEVTDLPASEGRAVSTVVPLMALGNGAAPPASSIFFYRFMRVDSVETEILEHPSTDGLFNGFVRVRVHTHSQAEFEAAWPVGDIAIATEVV